MSEEIKPQPDKRGEIRKNYESSELIKTVKKQLDNILLALLPAAQEEHKHSELLNLVRKGISVAELVAKYPATRIADELVNTVVMVGGLERRLNDAEKMAYTDSLSQLKNRRFFDDKIIRDIERRHNGKLTSLSLLIYDFDNFKKINDNDQSGHIVGDDVIRAISNLAQKTFSKSCDITRYGGEEFAVIMPYDEDMAHKVCQGFVEKVAQIEFNQSNYPRQVTISGGIAVCEKGDQKDDLVMKADDALYAAKKAGKNRLIAYRPNIRNLVYSPQPKTSQKGFKVGKYRVIISKE